MLKDHFDKVLNDYIKFKEDNNNKYANFQSITQSIPAALTIFFENKGLSYSTKGSNGVGVFSDVPWIMINDPNVCKSAKDGLYIVYLFKADMSGFYLSLNQGTENKNKKDVFKTAEYIRKQINTDKFSKNVIDVASDGQRPKNYVNANIVSKYYEKNKFDEDELLEDLLDICNVYQQIVINNKLTQIKYDDFITNVVLGILESKEEVKEVITMDNNVLLYGVPGCGKSHSVNTEIDSTLKIKPEDKYRVTFYSDYTYADFIGQIIPQTNNGELKYEFSLGVFSLALKKALEYKKEGVATKVALIVEEINRGNAPAIFGEVFQLLDRDDDGRSEYPIKNPMLAEKLGLPTNADIYLPENFYLYATMNTSDQNVFPLDTAFKRRWTMRYINDCDSNPKYSGKVIKNIINNFCEVESSITWDDFHKLTNLIIQNQLAGTYNSEDKGLGYFFIKSNEIENPRSFGEKILQYLWFDVFNLKHNEIFNFTNYQELVKSYLKGNFKMFGNDQQSLFRESCKPEKL